MYYSLSQKFGSRNQGVTKRGRSGQIETHLHCFLSPSDIQEFYEVTLLDSQRWVESSKTPDAVTAVTLWDFSSLQSTAVTSDTLPSLSTSIEVNCMSCDLPSTGSAALLRFKALPATSTHAHVEWRVGPRRLQR